MMEGELLNYKGGLNAEEEASLQLTREFKAAVNVLKDGRLGNLFSVVDVCEEFAARYDRAADNSEKATLMEDMLSAISIHTENIVAGCSLDSKVFSSETFQNIAKRYSPNQKTFSFESLHFDEKSCLTATAPIEVIEAARAMINIFMDKTNCKEAFASIRAPLKAQAESLYKEATASEDAPRIEAIGKLLHTIERLQAGPPLTQTPGLKNKI